MDKIDLLFDEGFDAAVQLFRGDNFEQCNSRSRGMLFDSRIPGSHYVTCLTLLGGIVSDWKQAYSCYAEAETI
jgi:hypothetical protein